jgi:hypothetical protein
VSGARLHYEVRGTGPLLLVIGSPMAAPDFEALAQSLADMTRFFDHEMRGTIAS